MSALGYLELGKAQFVGDSPDEALASVSRALTIDPGSAAALINLAKTRRRLNRFDEAYAAAAWSSSVYPRDVDALCELGHCLKGVRRFDEGVICLSRSVVLQPNQPGSMLTLAFCLLHMGSYERGWRFYEFRWRDDEFLKGYRQYPWPIWRGQPSIRGRSLMVFSEQGFGDTIQFVRFIRDLQVYQAEITLLVPPALEGLLRNVPGVVRVTSKLEKDDAFNACCPLMSLPVILGLTAKKIAVSSGAYLVAPRPAVDQWGARVGPRTLPRVGVCWSGSENPRMPRRSIFFDELAPLLIEELEFFSLNKDLASRDSAALANYQGRMRHFGAEIGDFAMTSGLIELMDLVITIDTATAHLAGSIGKEVWILLPLHADWRWSAAAATSPWYSNARLFRQTREDGWAEVIDQVAVALRARFNLSNRKL